MIKKTFFKLFYPGLKVKRWILLSIFGIIIIGLSSALFLTNIIDKTVGIINISIGVIFVIWGMERMLRSLLAVCFPGKDRDIVSALFQKRYLEKGPKIVTIGGGTGLSVILRGLKEYTNNITAIVTVADSGGSSGRLREQFDILPPGDIRNCLVALADAEPLMRDLFQFRFPSKDTEKDSGIHGHNFGNLFITAMTKLTGDFEVAIKESSKILAIRGQVIPSTLNNVSLVAEYKDGSQTEGEEQIPKSNSLINRVFLKPQDPKPTKEALKALQEADIIILGPGSLYTSIIPNLLVKGIPEAIMNSSTRKVYVCNVMTQAGETDGYKASDHLKAIMSHTHDKILDTCIVNVAKIPPDLLNKYKEEGSFPVEVDSQNIKDMGYSCVEGELISTADYVRHDSDKLSRLIISILESYKNIKR